MLDELNVFLKIVESSSMSEAGRLLKISNATVARKLATLEKRMGVKLLERNTRAMALTKAGLHCFDRCKSIPAIIDDMMCSAQQKKQSLRGSLDISIATYSGYHELLPKLVTFNQKYPNLTLNISKSNVFPDLIDDSYHAYIRYGEVQTRAMTSIKLVAHQMCLCASEDYLRKSLPLNHLDSLAEHHCIVHQYNRHEGDEWEFVVDGQSLFKKIKGCMVLNNSSLVMEAMQAGGGVAYLPRYIVQNLENVKMLLPDIWPRPRPVFLTHPRGQLLYEKTRVFVDFLKQSYGV